MEYMHESIFKSALRAFFKTVFIIFGVFAAFIPIIISLGAISENSAELDKHTVEILPDLDGNQKYLPINTPAVLRIDIHGVIGVKGLYAKDIRSQLIESRRGLLKDDRVKAVLLHIQSPGGSTNDSDIIYQLIKDYKEKYNVPVYTYVEGLCASGGMYIACSSDYIMSNPVSIIGSVGVYSGPHMNVKDGLDKLGISSLIVSKGKGKTNLSPFQKWEPGEEKSLTNIIEYLYGRFVDIVATNRPKIGKDKLINDYGANIFDAKAAQQNGYIDEGDITYEQALKKLLQAANIDTSKPYQVVRMEPKQDWLKYLSDSSANLLSGNVKHTLQLGSYETSELKDPFLYLYQPGR